MPDNTPHPKAQSFLWWLSRIGNVGLFFIAGVLLIILLGIAQRIGWIEGGSLASSSSAEGSQVIHTCSMHPQIRQPGPGRCPICGMKLVVAATLGANLDEFAIKIEPAQRRLANIQTAEVSHKSVSSSIRTIGAIQIDESREATIAAYIDGRVERLFADYTGVEVDKGDHLAVVYSPQLYSAQVEYIEATRTLSKNSGTALASVREAQTKLVANSRQRLVELGMTQEQLTELESSSKAQSRLTIYAPSGGTVIEKLAEEGKYISAGEPIYRIANLSTVWLMLALYPENASRIRFGQVVNAELTSLPGETLIGRVAFVDPTVNKKNRTVGVRVEFNNEDGKLRPGDYAHASIDIPIGPQGEIYDRDLAGKWISPMHPQVVRDQPGDCPICGMKLVPTSRYGYVDQPVSQPKSITIPRSALLMAGAHSVVYVETEPGRFELRNVTLGPILKNEAIILGGLKPGEKVATSGNFLIDSQMQLSGKPSLIDPTRLISKHPNKPLDFPTINVVRVQGPTGKKLEQLYEAYFTIQKTLSEDKVPTEEAVTALSTLSDDLSQDESLSEELRQQMTTIKDSTAHLHHLSIDEARKKFMSLSHAVVTLATEIRGQKAEQTFNHYYCPMVEQGKGNWLQAEGQLRNPYFGPEMLRCGELVRKISPDAKSSTPHSNHSHEQDGSPSKPEGAK